MTHSRMRRRGPCPRCHYIGNRHLCGCIGAIGKALDEGDPERARALLREMTDAANEEERRIEVIPC